MKSFLPFSLLCAAAAVFAPSVADEPLGKPLAATRRPAVFDLDTTQAPPPRFLPVIPQPKSWVPSGRAVFTVPEVLRVSGSSEAARVLIGDWRTVRGHHAAEASAIACADVVFRPIAKMDAKDESYRIEITPERMTVFAKGPTGEYWATRTILQLFNASPRVPCGTIDDAPRYAYRGFMLDVARKPYSLEFLRQLTKNLAYYKMNVFHIHLNDDGVSVFIGNKGYSRFRMECETSPELTAKDGHYKKADFRNFVKEAARIGVTIIPEIDTPAHAGCFTQVHREFASKEYGRTHFALDKPEVVEFMDKLFAEYLGGSDPVFAGPYFHVGTDEYDKRAAELFRAYTDKMLKLAKKYGKIPCAWGALTHADGKTPVISDGVVMDIWHNPYYHPLKALEAGYKIVSVPDRCLYMVPAAGYYKDYLDCRWIFKNWEPCNVHNVTIPHDHPQLLGGKFALWNDISGNGISEDDTFDRVFPAVQTLSQKMWTGTVSNQSWEAFSEIAANTFEAPGVNQADRLTGANGRPSVDDVAVGWTQNGGYTVSFEVQPSRADCNDVLFDDGFSRVRFFDGCVGFERDGISHTYTCKPEPGKWTLLVFSGDAKGVELIADGARYPKSVGVRTKKWGKRSVLREANRTLHFPLKLTPAGRRSVRDFDVKTGLFR